MTTPGPENNKNEYRVVTDPNTKTTRHLKKTPGGNYQLHNTEGPALIPGGNPKKAEYYINGIQYTKDQFLEVKKNGTGLPFYKKSGGNVRV